MVPQGGVDYPDEEVWVHGIYFAPIHMGTLFRVSKHPSRFNSSIGSKRAVESGR